MNKPDNYRSRQENSISRFLEHCGRTDAQHTSILFNRAAPEWLRYTQSEDATRSNVADILPPVILSVPKNTHPEFQNIGCADNSMNEIAERDEAIFSTATFSADIIGRSMVPRATTVDITTKTRAGVFLWASNSEPGTQTGIELSMRKRKSESWQFRIVDELVEQRTRELTRQNEELDRQVEQMKLAYETTRQRAQDLETLVYVISHDLKEPVRAIKSFSSLVRDRYSARLDEKGKDFLFRIGRAGERLNQLIDDITILSRADCIEIPTEEVGLEGILYEVLVRLEAQIEKSGAEIKLVLPLPMLRIQRGWIAEATYNLVANALKFVQNSDAPVVEIAGYDANGEVGFSVRDNGPGVKPEDADRIFQLFQRAVGREVDGTGAGLAIVRKIAHRHGGHAWVQSVKGGGSKFFMTIDNTQKHEQDNDTRTSNNAACR